MVMFIVYHMDDGREIALFGCFVVFLFGIFRLSAREFAVIRSTRCSATRSSSRC